MNYWNSRVTYARILRNGCFPSGTYTDRTNVLNLYYYLCSRCVIIIPADLLVQCDDTAPFVAIRVLSYIWLNKKNRLLRRSLALCYAVTVRKILCKNFLVID